MKITPEYSEGQQSYRDGKSLEDNPYKRKRFSGNIHGSNEAERWLKGWMDAYAEWAEGKQDESADVSKDVKSNSVG